MSGYKNFNILKIEISVFVTRYTGYSWGKFHLNADNNKFTTSLLISHVFWNIASLLLRGVFSLKYNGLNLRSAGLKVSDYLLIGFGSSCPELLGCLSAAPQILALQEM